MGKENNSRQKAVSRMMFSGSVREIGVFVALIIMVIIFALIDSSYVTVGNFVDIVKQATINGILAIGITFAIISGGIDLSLGSTFAIVIVAVGQLTVLGVPPVAAICAGAVLGTFMGSINGLLVTKMRLQPFIATLGTMSVFRNLTASLAIAFFSAICSFARAENETPSIYFSVGMVAPPWVRIAFPWVTSMLISRRMVISET